MKNILLGILCTFLLACTTTVPVTRKFPDAPELLMQPAPQLTPLPPNTTELSALINNANDNYLAYRALRERYEAWQQWYHAQRENFDSVK